jgi:hypothetical protein
VAQGTYQHHDSGWIFPQQAVGFKRSGAPQDVDGSRNVIAYYAREDEGVRSTAVIDVYPKDFAVPLTLAQAQAEIERELGASAKKARSQLQVSKQPARVATKASYLSPAAATYLYFIDSGEWMVRIRIRSQVLGARVLDDFVLEQRWDSLGLPLQS